MKHTKRILAGFLVAAMVMTGLSFPDTAMADTENQQEAEGEYNLSYHADGGWDVDASFEGKNRGDIANLKGTLPSAYSSVEKGYVTSVKDQGDAGNCWAQSAISLAETNYIKKYNVSPANVDFSEFHLTHYVYNTPADLHGIAGDDSFYLTGNNSLDGGGNNYFTMQVLANWMGVSDATVDEFGADDVDNYENDAMAYDDIVHLEDAYIVAMPSMQGDASKIDMEIVKTMIMEYGSVSISYYSDYTELDGYCYHPEFEWGNHAVTIVGWDDTIAQENFEYVGDDDVSCFPDGKGAWLVKNSWGTGTGMDGYFWLSYYDKTIASEGFVFNVEAADNYDNNYHVDNSASTNGWYTNWNNVEASAVVLQADSFESLEAVGFYTQNTDVNYEIRVYTGLTEGAAPNTGGLVLTQTGSEDYIGFHTVELSNPIALKQGERYAIVVTLSSDDTNETVYATVSYTETYSGYWYNSLVYAKEGQSYVGDSVDSLTDLNEGNTAFADGVDVCIKAYTNEITIVEENAIFLNVTDAELGGGATLQLVATVSPDNATFKGITFTSSDDTLATVDANGLVTANSTGKTGTVTITATSEYTNKTAACTITVKTDKVGWSYENGIWYYYLNGEALTGWLYDGGVWYYLNNDGAMATGWVWDGANWYYMNSSGAMQTGWILDGGTWYYLKSSGAMATGWVWDGSNWYYLKSSGAMATGWVWDGANWYYMNSSGAMATGWVWDGSNWYYMNSSGAMATGWVWDGSNWYYMNSSGAMQTGWLWDGANWYYLKSSGAMATGRCRVDGRTYYFHSSGAWIR